MWKKNDEAPVNKTSPTNKADSPFQAPKAAERSVMGSTLCFKGEIFGEENLVIQSEVEGLIDLRNHSVTVGKSGRLKADIYGKNVNIEGKVVGNVVGFDNVRIAQTGSVKGNVTSPRVMLEDGAKFKGSIDMDMPKNKTAEEKPSFTASPKPDLQKPDVQKPPISSDIGKPKTI